jgi:hypothetical protein
MRAPIPDLGTAVWLVEHTALTFDQTASFCGMTMPEVQAVADEELASGQPGRDPIAGGLLTAAEIARCTHAPAARLARFSPRTRADLPIAHILDAITEGHIVSVPEIAAAGAHPSCEMAQAAVSADPRLGSPALACARLSRSRATRTDRSALRYVSR